MHLGQVNRLKQQSKQMGHFIHKLNKQGKKDKAYKMTKKQNYLNSQILDLEQD